VLAGQRARESGRSRSRDRGEEASRQAGQRERGGRRQGGEERRETGRLAQLLLIALLPFEAEEREAALQLDLGKR